MASQLIKRSMHVALLLPQLAAMACCLLPLMQYTEAAHRKLSLPKLPTARRTLLVASSSDFYNAFDTRFPNTATFNANRPRQLPLGDEYNAKDIVDSELNAKNYPTGYSEFNANNYPSGLYGNHANLPSTTTDTRPMPTNQKFKAHKHDVGEANADGFNDIVDDEFNANSYPNSYGGNNANHQVATPNTQQARVGQFDYPTKSEFSSSPPSSSTSSLYGGKFPTSFEAPSSQDHTHAGYGKQSFPSTDQQGMHNYPSNAKSFPYNSPSMVDASPFEEQNLSKSPSTYGASYDSFHGVDINESGGSEFNDLKDHNHVPTYDFKKEKPVSNYDRFFNSPTVHKDEIEGSKFPISDHDLTYGRVQVP